MASSGPRVTRTLSTLYRHTGRFEKGIASELPAAYQKFWREWKVMRPAAVHFVEQEGKWKRDELTGETLPIQNIPIPLKYPKEIHSGIWGGEAVVKAILVMIVLLTLIPTWRYQLSLKGFQKRELKRRRVAHYWVPVLKRTVVRSEVLNTHLSVVVTERTMKLITDHYGFDHYLLKTPACDLVSVLALKLKKKILLELLDDCPRHAHNPTRQKEILDEYKDYLSAYTPEEIEWYGLTWMEALRKITKIKEDANRPVPLKNVYRRNLIEKLRAAGISEAQGTSEVESSSWLSKMNPFSKKDEA